MEKIAVISASQSYLLTSLKEQLEGLEYEVDILKADVDTISRMDAKTVGILLYLDEKLLDDVQTMIYIRDKSMEDETPIFAIGSEENVVMAEKIMKDRVIRDKFYRPIDVKQVAQKMDNYIKVSGKQNKKKILVVDDSGAMLRNVKGWLEDRYQIILANSGAMAIKYLSLNRPDLVLLDYEMPVCNGKQVLEMIRTETDFKDIPVIFLTSRGDRESVMEVMALKPEGYLLKTMKPEQIIRNVDEFFAKQKYK